MKIEDDHVSRIATKSLSTAIHVKYVLDLVDDCLLRDSKPTMERMRILSARLKKAHKLVCDIYETIRTAQEEQAHQTSEPPQAAQSDTLSFDDVKEVRRSLH